MQHFLAENEISNRSELGKLQVKFEGKLSDII